MKIVYKRRYPVYRTKNLTGKNMADEHSAWDRDYAARGRLWGGAPAPLPDLPDGSRILELGCGNGSTLAALAGSPWDVVAIDFSKEAVKISRKNIGRNHQSGILVADARCLPFRSGMFDAVIAFHVAGHMLQPDRRRIAEESTRVLKKGGQLLFREFSADDLRAGAGTLVEDGTHLRGRGIYAHYFTEEEVLKLFSGLTPLALRTDYRLMKVRGKGLVRAEIYAVFFKEE
jgi:ubiquinone/menaquinone biosynthesis C-methylase UbiE